MWCGCMSYLYLEKNITINSKDLGRPLGKFVSKTHLERAINYLRTGYKYLGGIGVHFDDVNLDKKGELNVIKQLHISLMTTLIPII